MITNWSKLRERRLREEIDTMTDAAKVAEIIRSRRHIYYLNRKLEAVKKSRLECIVNG